MFYSPSNTTMHCSKLQCDIVYSLLSVSASYGLILAINQSVLSTCSPRVSKVRMDDWQTIIRNITNNILNPMKNIKLTCPFFWVVFFTTSEICSRPATHFCLSENVGERKYNVRLGHPNVYGIISTDNTYGRSLVAAQLSSDVGMAGWMLSSPSVMFKSTSSWGLNSESF